MRRAIDFPKQSRNDSGSYHTDSEEVLMVLGLDLASTHLRRQGNPFFVNDTRMRLGIRGQLDGGFNVRPQRGDRSEHNHSVRIHIDDTAEAFTIEGGYPSRIVFPGLSLQPVMQEESTHLRNKGSDRWTPGVCVKAITVDGKGGTIDWTEIGGRPVKPCLWFFIENGCIRTPTRMRLLQLTGVNRRKGIGRINAWNLSSRAVATQRLNINQWFQVYKAWAENSPLQRPMTERYFYQLRQTDRPQNLKDDEGERFFGPHLYARLHDGRDAIRGFHCNCPQF